MKLYRVSFSNDSKLVVARSFNEALRYSLECLTGPRPAGLCVQPMGFAPRWLRGPIPREVHTLLPAIRMIRLTLPLLAWLGFATEPDPPSETQHQHQPGIERRIAPDGPEEDPAETGRDDHAE